MVSDPERKRERSAPRTAPHARFIWLAWNAKLLLLFFYYLTTNSLTSLI